MCFACADTLEANSRRLLMVPCSSARVCTCARPTYIVEGDPISTCKGFGASGGWSSRIRPNARRKSPIAESAPRCARVSTSLHRSASAGKVAPVPAGSGRRRGGRSDRTTADVCVSLCFALVHRELGVECRHQPDGMAAERPVRRQRARCTHRAVLAYASACTTAW